MNYSKFLLLTLLFTYSFQCHAQSRFKFPDGTAKIACIGSGGGAVILLIFTGLTHKALKNAEVELAQAQEALLRSNAQETIVITEEDIEHLEKEVAQLEQQRNIWGALTLAAGGICGVSSVEWYRNHKQDEEFKNSKPLRRKRTKQTNKK